MGKKIRCENCIYYMSFGDAMNPRTDGVCKKLRLSDFGMVRIHTKEDYFCSLFKKEKEGSK